MSPFLSKVHPKPTVHLPPILRDAMPDGGRVEDIELPSPLFQPNEEVEVFMLIEVHGIEPTHCPRRLGSHHQETSGESIRPKPERSSLRPIDVVVVG